MKNLKKLSRTAMKNVQGAALECNPVIICQKRTDCCPGWACPGRGQYCIAI